MTIEAVVRAVESEAGSPLNKLVLVLLADNASPRHPGEFPSCEPKLDRLSRRCEVNRKAVIDSMRALERLGLVRVVWKRGRPELVLMTFGQSGDWR